MFNLFFIRRTNELARTYLDKPLMNRIRLFFIILVLMVCLIAYDITDGTIGPILAIVGFLLGLGTGFITSRIFNIHWHESHAKVAFRIDRMGTTILVLYSIFTILRERIFEQFVRAEIVSAFAFAFLAGVFLGRLVSMYVSIKKILIEKGIQVN